MPVDDCPEVTKLPGTPGTIHSGRASFADPESCKIRATFANARAAWTGDVVHILPVKAAESLSSFHHWLLDAERPHEGMKRALVLHGAPQHPELSGEIAHYLNQYDDDSCGRWIAMAPSLIKAIAADESQRRLLGMAAPCPNCPPTGACGIRKVIAALVGHGFIVIDSLHAPAAAESIEGIFHVSLESGNDDCSLQLNPHHFRNQDLAPIIGDVYLEWLHGSMVAIDNG